MTVVVVLFVLVANNNNINRVHCLAKSAQARLRVLVVTWGKNIETI